MQLFLDDKWIEQTAGLRRVLGQPVKHPTPILGPDQLWEAHDLHGLHSLVWDAEEGKLKLWYRASVRRQAPSAATEDQSAESSEREATQIQNYLCYAESLDGLKWTKPALGLHEFSGSRDNNIIQPVGTASLVFGQILKDPLDPDPTKRYKAFGFDHHPVQSIAPRGAQSHGLCVAYSPDGLHWSGATLVLSTSDLTDADYVFPSRDPHTGKWVAFMRPRTHPKRRFIGYSTSDDFEHWTYPRMLLTPDAGDSEFIEFYGLTTTYVDGYYLGILWVFHNNPSFSPMTNELVFSRDGQHYTRVMPGHQFLALGEAGDFDSRMITALGIINRDADLWIYYNGANYDHGSDRGQSMPPGVVEPGQPRRHAVGLARLSRGHYAGYRADHDGMLETKYVTNYGGPGLRILADIAPGGSIRAEILDHYGRVLPGWERENCRAVPQADGSLGFAWGGAGLSGQLDDESPEGGKVQRVIKLRLFLHQATVFGFSVGDA